MKSKMNAMHRHCSHNSGKRQTLGELKFFASDRRCFFGQTLHHIFALWDISLFC